MKNRRETKIVILGAGRLGGALHRALSRAGFSSALISRPRTPIASANAQKMLGQADVNFLCVPDSQIPGVTETYAEVFHPGQIVAHCAGALTLDALNAASQKGVSVGSLHPLCAIASPETSFLGIHAALCGTPAVRDSLREIARAAGMIPFDLLDADRARYHAAAAMASNCVMALASLSASLFESCGLERSRAVSALLPLMRSALVAMEQKGLPAALTGPIARGDAGVVQSHIRALSRPDDAEVLKIYALLSVRLIELSRELGAASEDSLAAISQAIDGVLTSKPPVSEKSP